VGMEYLREFGWSDEGNPVRRQASRLEYRTLSRVKLSISTHPGVVAARS
jgi:hypothetical protein